MSLFALGALGAVSGGVLGSLTGGDKGRTRDAAAMQIYLANKKQEMINKGFSDAKADLGYLDIGEDMLNQLMIESGQAEGDSRFEMSPMWQQIEQEQQDEVAQQLANSGMMFSGAGVKQLGDTSARVKSAAYDNYMGQLNNLMNIGQDTTQNMINLDLAKIGKQADFYNTQSNIMASKAGALNQMDSMRNQNIMSGVMGGAQLGMGIGNMMGFGQGGQTGGAYNSMMMGG